MTWKKIIGHDLNLDSALEAEGGSLALKKSSVSKPIEIKDIYRNRNKKEK